jgi:diguanylate cyclase (GGDEF)-like protein
MKPIDGMYRGGGDADRIVAGAEVLLKAATTPRAACRVVVEQLVAHGHWLPSVYLAEGGRLRCYAVSGYWQIYDGMPPSAGVIGQTYRTGTAHAVRAGEDPRYLTASEDVVEQVCVPVRSGGPVVGVLNLESVDALPAGTQQMLTALADRLGAVLDRMWSPQDASPLRRITHHGILLAAATSWGEAVDRVLAAACDLAGMESAVLAVHAGARWSIAGARGTLGAPIAGLSSDELNQVATWVAQGTSCYTPGRDEGKGMPGAQRLRGWGVRSLAVVPLDAAGERQGFLLTADEHRRTSSTGKAERLELLGALAAGTLRTHDVLRELRHVADRDALTGLLHHGRFREDLADLLRHPQAGVTATLLLVDLDQFKQVNDMNGHLVGDDILRATAIVLTGSLRTGDRAYRIGGDEFAVLLRGRYGDGGYGVAARLHTGLREQLAPRTASIGLARVRPGDQPDALVHRADTALYAAKRAGRDTLASAEPASEGAHRSAASPAPRQRSSGRHG